MSENQTPVVEAPAVEAKAPEAPEAQAKASPAQELRDIQNLLVGGIFPGNMAPAIVRAYQMLENMAKQVEGTSVATSK